MAKNEARAKLVWMEFDTSVLPADLQKKIASVHRMMAEQSALQKTVQEGFVAYCESKGKAAPSGKSIKVGFNFGKFAFAMADEAAASSASKKVSF